MEHQTLTMNAALSERPAAASGPAGRLIRFCNGLDQAFRYACQAIILTATLVLLVLLAVNVVARYALHEGGIAWISEMPGQFFPWLIAAGIVLAVQRGSHIAVDFALGALGARGGRLLAIGIQLLVAASYAILAFVIWDLAGIAAAEHTPLLGIPNSWGYYALLYAACGTTLCSLSIAVRVAMLGKAALPQGDPLEAPL